MWSMLTVTYGWRSGRVTNYYFHITSPIHITVSPSPSTLSIPATPRQTMAAPSSKEVRQL